MASSCSTSSTPSDGSYLFCVYKIYAIHYAVCERVVLQPPLDLCVLTDHRVLCFRVMSWAWHGASHDGNNLNIVHINFMDEKEGVLVCCKLFF